MRNYRFISFFFLLAFFLTKANASPFKQDDKLVNLCHQKNLKLIVFRHNEALNNFENIVTSSRSPGYALTRVGIAELKEKVLEFKFLGIGAIYSSPLFRSLQVANVIGTSLELTPLQMIADDNLAMQNFGTFEGAQYSCYESLFSSVEDMLEGNAPEGEPGIKVFRRTRKALLEIVHSEYQTVLVVTHAFNCCHIRMLLTGQFGSLPSEGEYTIYDFTTPECTIIRKKLEN